MFPVYGKFFLANEARMEQIEFNVSCKFSGKLHCCQSSAHKIFPMKNCQIGQIKLITNVHIASSDLVRGSFISFN